MASPTTIQLLLREFKRTSRTNTVLWTVGESGGSSAPGQLVLDNSRSSRPVRTVIYWIKLILQVFHALATFSTFTWNLVYTDMNVSTTVQGLFPLCQSVLFGSFALENFWNSHSLVDFYNAFVKFNHQQAKEVGLGAKDMKNKKLEICLTVNIYFQMFQTTMMMIRSFRFPNRFPFMAALLSDELRKRKALVGIFSVLEGFLYYNRVRLFSTFILLLVTQRVAVLSFLNHLIRVSRDKERRGQTNLDFEDGILKSFVIYKRLVTLNRWSDHVYRRILLPVFISTCLVIWISCAFAAIRTFSTTPFPALLQFPAMVIVVSFISYVVAKNAGEMNEKSWVFLQAHNDLRKSIGIGTGSSGDDRFGHNNSFGSISRLQLLRVTARSFRRLRANVADFYFIQNTSYITFINIAFQQTVSFLLIE